MQVRVLFFGVLKDLAGRSSDVISLPDQATAADVLEPILLMSRVRQAA